MVRNLCRVPNEYRLMRCFSCKYLHLFNDCEGNKIYNEGSGDHDVKESKGGGVLEYESIQEKS